MLCMVVGLRTEATVSYSIKMLSQLSPILKGFRKEKGLTQAIMAERLGVTQQSYAYFEANRATATLERLFMVLRMLDVEISLDDASPASGKGAIVSINIASEAPGAVATKKAKPSPVAKASPIVAPSSKKESW